MAHENLLLLLLSYVNNDSYANIQCGHFLLAKLHFRFYFLPVNTLICLAQKKKNSHEGTLHSL